MDWNTYESMIVITAAGGSRMGQKTSSCIVISFQYLKTWLNSALPPRLLQVVTAVLTTDPRTAVTF